MQTTTSVETTSPLWNRDLAPTTAAQRTWTTYDFAALWVGLSVVITTYTLASGLMQQGMAWWQAMLTILLGNTIVLVPMLLNAHAGARYGISFPVLCRAPFGVVGANIPAMLRAIVACGWFGIQTWIGGLALDTLLQAAWPAWKALAGSTWIAFVLFWLMQVAIIVRGTEGIRRLERAAAPLLLAGGAALFWWAVDRGGGLGTVLAESARLQGSAADAWRLFPAGLTAAVGYWATLSLNIPDFTRYARSQRAHMLGQALGLPLTMTAFAFIGVVVTSAALVVLGEAVWDPVELIRRIGSPLAIVAGALVVLVAQISTNLAANVVAPANDFSNLSPRRIGYVAGGLITAVVGIAIMPWRLYADAGAYIFTWLIGYSSLMGAIGGVLIADYWIVRRRQLVVADLFRVDGIYAYTRGVNLRAVAALAIAIAPVVPGFLRAAVTPGGQVANPGLVDHVYTYAWFVTFAVSFAVYLVVSGRSGRSEAQGPAVTETGEGQGPAPASRRFRRFDSATPEYTEAFHTFLSHTDQKEQALAWLDREVGALARRRVAIDAGAGTGKLTAWLAERFERVIGIEPNPTLAAEFRSTCPGARLIPQTILQATPATDADFVLCSHVFYYLPRETWEQNLARLMEWLAPGGVLAVAIQNPETDCMRMIDHFVGGRLSLRELVPAAEAAGGGTFRVRLDTVPARIRTDDYATVCRIAEFVLNSAPLTRTPSWDELESYVRAHFARPDGTFEMSCDQDFLRVEAPSGG